MARPDAALVIRPVRDDAGIATWVAIHNAVATCWPVGPASLAETWRQAPRWESQLVHRDGRPVGIGHIEVQHWSPGSRHADAEVVVPQEERRAGVGSALYRHMSAWARAEGLDGLDVWVREDAPGAFPFWPNRGFTEVGRERVSRLDLAASPIGRTPPATPEGVRITSMAAEPGLEHAMYEVAREAMPDVPGPDGYDPGEFAHWAEGEVGLTGVIPECAMVAVAGDRVIGYAILIREEARPDVANHGMTAVARDWRGRGVARALKEHQIAAARAQGLAWLEAENEERNHSMRAINTGLGYAPLPAYVQLRGPLTPGR